ncbi:hypothetical protein WN55_07112 [Dufourea novaeangliae]|uniref:Uncharacterized protein n=1 Tax=Dufourea novaeangliae TaxID=178035 RepID=A0A154P266_DUFNO|nr:hypothetical protein WN55_07112 [Dufourea novaeangliae]
MSSNSPFAKVGHAFEINSLSFQKYSYGNTSGSCTFIPSQLGFKKTEPLKRTPSF